MAFYEDPRILRAVAHPTRNRILSELYAGGPLRAADLARSLDVPANQASFHLRQLAKYGLVEEAPDAARDRRDRVWRLADPDGISFRTRDMEAQPGGKAALSVFRRNAIAWGQRLVSSAHDGDIPEGTDKIISDWALRLTKDEAKQIAEEVDALMRRWRDRQIADEEERTTYSLYMLVQPYPAMEVVDLTSEERTTAAEPGRMDAAARTD